MNAASTPTNSAKKKSPLVFWSVFLAATIGLGAGAGFGMTKLLKPDSIQYIVDEDQYTIDMEATRKKYQAAKSSKSFASLTPEEMINIGYDLFAKDENNYTVGVGYTQAAMVRQIIQTRSVKMGERFFEESNSIGMVNLYDRMFQEGDNTVKYWGSTPDYGSNQPETVSNADYRIAMGRNVSDSLVYIVSEKTKIETPSPGDPPNGIYQENGNYRVEITLDPTTSVARYQCQMQTISNLKYKPTFDFVHLSVVLDADLNLIKMTTHEKYFATISSGLGSTGEGSLTTMYYHEAPSYGFPSVNSKLPDFPDSL